jgi:hypothetical protein
MSRADNHLKGTSLRVKGYTSCQDGYIIKKVAKEKRGGAL